MLESRLPAARDLAGALVFAEVRSGPEGPLVFWKRPAKTQPCKRILLSAGIHGDEPAGVLAVLELLESGRLDPAVEWWIAPCLCPEAFLAHSRTNLQGIDLNRDFREPQSTEVRWYRGVLARIPPPDLHLSLHEDWEYGGGYVYEINSSHHPSLSSAIVGALERTAGLAEEACLDGHVVTSRGYIHHPVREDEPGRWPEAIHLARAFPLRSYTIETPSCLALPLRVEAACESVIAAANALRSIDPLPPAAPSP